MYKITSRTISANNYASGLVLGVDDNGNLVWTSATVSNNSITSLHLTSNAVTSIKLADIAITSSNFIATGTGSFLALNTSGNLIWTSETVTANSITSLHLTNKAVTSSKIAATDYSSGKALTANTSGKLEWSVIKKHSS